MGSKVSPVHVLTEQQICDACAEYVARELHPAAVEVRATVELVLGDGVEAVVRLEAGHEIPS